MKWNGVCCLGAMLCGCATDGLQADERVDEIQRHALPAKFWEMEPAAAALAYVQKVHRADQGTTIALPNGTKAVEAGSLSYGGSRNILGLSNNLIRFGSKTEHLTIRFTFTFTRSWDPESATAACYLGQNDLDPRANHLCQVVTCLRGVDVKLGDGPPLSTTTTHYNPPTSFNGLTVYDDNGKLVYREKSFLSRKKVRMSDYAEALLYKHRKKFGHVAGESFDPYANPVKRAALIEELRTLLGDPGVPHEFLNDVLQGVDQLVLTELLPSVTRLSDRIAPKATYLDKLGVLQKKFEGVWDPDQATRTSSSWVEYRRLQDRYLDDDTQRLRAQIDHAKKSLQDAGDRPRILARIIARENVDHLMYHIFRTDRKEYARLGIERLRRADSAWGRARQLADLEKHGAGLLLDYLEGCNEKQFVRCSAGASKLIRAKKPEWKQRLQGALARYSNVVSDEGRWRLNGLEALVPEDDPNYFDQEVVAAVIRDMEKNPDQFTSQYFDRKDVLKDIAEVKARLGNRGPR